MDIAIYGGSFNPPHLGHAAAVRSAWEQLRPDAFLIIPAAVPPHKRLPQGSPDGQARLESVPPGLFPLPLGGGAGPGAAAGGPVLYHRHPFRACTGVFPGPG